MTEKKNFATQYHRPVLLDETLAALDIRPDSVYLDGTAGGGGHSTAIASRLTTGRLIALDQDPDAVREASRRLEGLPAVVVRSNFTAMDQVLEELGVKAVDGILLDIGVSSHQLDAPERGFSYHHDAPLDMRMSQSLSLIHIFSSMMKSIPPLSETFKMAGLQIPAFLGKEIGDQTPAEEPPADK